MSLPKRNIASTGPPSSIDTMAMPPRMPMVPEGVLIVTGVFLLILPPTRRKIPLVAEKTSSPIPASGS